MLLRYPYPDAQHVLVAGVDEVGRGPLAGDVVAAAVILDPKHPIAQLNDSKKLTALQREKLFDLIVDGALYYALGRANVAEIDAINILQASLLAMSRAAEALTEQPGFIYVDGIVLVGPTPAWRLLKGTQRLIVLRPPLLSRRSQEIERWL